MSHLLNRVRVTRNSSLPSQTEDRSVFATKHARRLIENDAQLLANRVAFLKQEEIRSWKKIEEAKKKALDVFAMKVNNGEKQREKEFRMEINNQYLKDTQTNYLELRRQAQMKKTNIRNALFEQKHNEMLQIKRQREINEASKREFQERTLQHKRSKSMIVKEKESQSRLKLDTYYKTKFDQFQQNHQTINAVQESLKRKKEAEVLMLEKLEQEMISKVQEVHTLEKAAYEQLDEALNIPTKEFQTKYNIESIDFRNRRTMASTKRSSTPLASQTRFDSRSFFSSKQRFNEENLTTESQNRTQGLGSLILKPNESEIRKGTQEDKLKREEKIYGRKLVKKNSARAPTPKTGSLNGSLLMDKQVKDRVAYRRNSMEHEQPKNSGRRSFRKISPEKKEESPKPFKTIGGYLGISDCLLGERPNEIHLHLFEERKDVKQRM